METTVIIGAGASGLICGHELAKSNHNVIILEQSNKAGRKILASGNGRCNLSNTNLDMYFYNPRLRGLFMPLMQENILTKLE